MRRRLWSGIPHPLWVVCHGFAGGDDGIGGELGAFGGAVGVCSHGVVLIGSIGWRGVIVVDGGRRLESSNCEGHDHNYLRACNVFAGEIGRGRLGNLLMRFGVESDITDPKQIKLHDVNPAILYTTECLPQRILPLRRNGPVRQWDPDWLP